jgi:hypothetical protein
LETDLQQMNSNFAQQNEAKDEMLRSLQGTLSLDVIDAIDQVTMWKNKYEQLAKLYSQLRQEHLELLTKFKSMHLKANSAQEAIDKKERIEREMKSKNFELADMIRERDRARYELDGLKGVSLFWRVANLFSLKRTNSRRSKESYDSRRRKPMIWNVQKPLSSLLCLPNTIARWQIWKRRFM